MIAANIITDSIGGDAPRLISVALTYPRFIHAELMTHRVFSRNAASSRAIPFLRMLKMIVADMALPSEWRMEERGMQGWTVASPEIAAEAERLVRGGFDHIRDMTTALADLGLHKQHVNRYLEPWQHIRTLVTASEWENFIGLRNHGDADPTLQALAKAFVEAREGSTPTLLNDGDWHLPYLTPEETGLALEDQMKVSAARCARVSYIGHDGRTTSFEDDIKLYDRLIRSDVIHASPVEHQAKPDFWLTKGKRWMNPERHGNLYGWQQARKFIPNENLDRLAA